jgi:hypothetical protein
MAGTLPTLQQFLQERQTQEAAIAALTERLTRAISFTHSEFPSLTIEQLQALMSEAWGRTHRMVDRAVQIERRFNDTINAITMSEWQTEIDHYPGPKGDA